MICDDLDRFVEVRLLVDVDNGIGELDWVVVWVELLLWVVCC